MLGRKLYVLAGNYMCGTGNNRFEVGNYMCGAGNYMCWAGNYKRGQETICVVQEIIGLR